MRTQRLPAHLRLLRVIGLVVLTLSVLPVAPTLAGITVNKPLDDTLDQFAEGNLQRTALAQLPSGGAGDSAGGVQLSRIGVLKTWFPVGTSLPEPLQRMGVVVVGNRIYVIGGLAPGAARRDKVYSIAVDQTDGAIIGEWTNEPVLPQVQGSNQLTNPLSAIVSPAVTTAAVGGTNYLYVIGGEAAVGAQSLSSYAVRIATLNAAGNISAWQEQVGARIIPVAGQTRDIGNTGRQQAKAVSVAINGKTFIYVVGGRQTYLSGSGGGGAATLSSGSTSVMVAQVGAAGKLYKPSNPSQEGWDFAGDMPVVPPNDDTLPYGLWDSGVTLDFYPTSGKYGLFVLGGQKLAETTTTDPLFDNFVYRAEIQNDGSLSWLDDFVSPGAVPANYTLPETRFGHGALGFGGSLYLTGGIPGGSNEPDENGTGAKGIVLTSYVNDNLSLPQVQGSQSNFNKAPALFHPRVFHGTALVRGAGTSNNGAFVYVIGGRGATGDSADNAANGSSEIIYGKIGDSEEESAGFALDGWYYSKPFTLYSQKATLKDVSWYAKVERNLNPNTDIQIDYRISTDNDCSRATWTDDFSATGWRRLDGSTDAFRSKNGLNTVANLTLESRCFQYRARLISGASALPATYTPGLLSFSVRIVLPGDIDLWPTPASKARFNATGALVGLDVYLTNQNQIKVNPNDPTISAATGSPSPNAQFFVDILLFPPGAAVTTPTFNNLASLKQYNKAYAVLEKGQFGPDVTLQLVQWCVQDDKPTCTLIDLKTLFTTAGTYALFIVADATNYVCEGGSPNEQTGICALSQQTKGKSNNIRRLNITIQAGSDGKPKVANERYLSRIDR